MTQRGSIAYYSAAVVCGCFFLVIALAGVGERSLRVSSPGFRDIFLLYFLAVAYGSVALLLFAFLLRQLARRIRWVSSVEWMVSGAILACALTWSMNAVWVKWLHALTFGPQRAVDGGLWRPGRPRWAFQRPRLRYTGHGAHGRRHGLGSRADSQRV
jgi:hypothetical protein